MKNLKNINSSDSKKISKILSERLRNKEDEEFDLLDVAKKLASRKAELED